MLGDQFTSMFDPETSTDKVSRDLYRTFGCYISIVVFKLWLKEQTKTREEYECGINEILNGFKKAYEEKWDKDIANIKAHPAHDIFSKIFAPEGLTSEAEGAKQDAISEFIVTMREILLDKTK